MSATRQVQAGYPQRGDPAPYVLRSSLGMGWMDPNWLARTSSARSSSGSALAIIFAECGLFFPFLPGDTLLFAIGLFISGDKIDVLPGGTASTSSPRSCS